LDPPVKHGQTRYQYIIFGFKKEEETTVEISLSPEAIQEKYGSNLQKQMVGPYHDIVSRLFRAITEQRITVPGSFTSKSGAKCVSCAYKASAGLLYPLNVVSFILQNHRSILIMMKLLRVVLIVRIQQLVVHLILKFN
jgi:structure-specific recognition protein 1